MATFKIKKFKHDPQPRKKYHVAEVWEEVTGKIVGPFGIKKGKKAYLVTHVQSGLAIGFFTRPTQRETVALCKHMADAIAWDGNDMAEIADANGIEPRDLWQRIIDESRAADDSFKAA